MSGLLATRAQIQSRLRDRRFWRRFAGAFCLGHLWGAAGFTFAFSAGAMLGSLTPASIVTAVSSLGPFSLFSFIMATVMVTGHVLFASLLLMLPLSLAALPVAALAAVSLRTARPGTSLCGALTGIAVALLFRGYLDRAGLRGAGLLLCAAAAGAMFAQPIWRRCIAPALGSGPSDENGTGGRWWTRRGPLAKAALIVAGLLVILVSI
jgi:hypothetical protein